MSDNSNKKDKNLDLNKVEEPITEYSKKNQIAYDSQIHATILQLIEKSKKNHEEGNVFSHEEAKKKIKERYPFLK